MGTAGCGSRNLEPARCLNVGISNPPERPQCHSMAPYVNQPRVGRFWAGGGFSERWILRNIGPERTHAVRTIQADVKIDRDEPWIRAQPTKLGEHGKAGRGSREFFRSHPVNESLQGFASGLDSAGIPTHPRPRPASSARPMRSSGRVEQQMTRRPTLRLHWPRIL